MTHTYLCDGGNPQRAENIMEIEVTHLTLHHQILQGFTSCICIELLHTI